MYLFLCRNALLTTNYLNLYYLKKHAKLTTFSNNQCHLFILITKSSQSTSEATSKVENGFI